MKMATSITIDSENLEFIKSIAKKEHTTRSEVIDTLLNKYRQFRLKRDISNGFKSQTCNDLGDAMSDFRDYLDIVGK